MCGTWIDIYCSPFCDDSSELTFSSLDYNRLSYSDFIVKSMRDKISGIDGTSRSSFFRALI